MSAQLPRGGKQGRKLLLIGSRPQHDVCGLYAEGQLRRHKVPRCLSAARCGGSFRDWISDSDVGAYAAKGLILVAVDGDCSYYMNAALDAKDRYEDYFVHDVLVDAESRLPFWTVESIAPW